MIFDAVSRVKQPQAFGPPTVLCVFPRCCIGPVQIAEAIGLVPTPIDTTVEGTHSILSPTGAAQHYLLGQDLLLAETSHESALYAR
jgi:hypothetical protein